jgi:AraC-like DNA-binding protein
VLIRSSSSRTLGPWMQGPTDACHLDTLEICVLTHGALAVRLGDQQGWHRAGEVSVVPAGVVHSCWTEAEGASEIIVHLDAAGLGAFSAGVWPAPAVLVERLARAFGPQERDAAVLALLAHLREAAAAPLVSDPRLARVVAAVRAQLTERWSLPGLARVAGMSVSAFRRAFTAAVGTSPVTWVVDQRVAAAARLLRQTERSVSEVASAVGFGSTSRLTEAFVRRHGVPPSVWRTSA